ncbi:hypothetical protein PN36_22975 [Candidatus Thiomargarita nelsonii]|uniref:Secreted protein n=1 Tax=Candidatus Thiomargarita nelsonii TaxID=1003181 RepID=A0A4E0QZL8_9GAMM|nr:hypothetical protein PN36_22975 [Candidatus Thiomargarita nelsonii]
MSKQTNKWITIIVIAWLSNLMMLCAHAQDKKVLIKVMTSNTSPTKQQLLKRQAAPQTKIAIPIYFEILEQRNEFFTHSRSKITAVSVVVHHGYRYLYPLEYINETGYFVWKRGWRGVNNELVLHLYFIGEKFDGGEIQEIKISSNPYTKDHHNKYYKLDELKLEIVYVKNGVKYNTRDDEIRLISDSGEPSQFAWLVCDDQCEKDEQKDIPKITYRLLCSGTEEKTFDPENFQESVNACGQNEQQELTVTVNVTPSVPTPPKSPITSEETEDSDENIIRIKPYSKLYGKEYILNPYCQYELIIENEPSIRLEPPLGKKYLSAANLKLTDTLTIKVAPKGTHTDCISKTYNLNADGNPEIKFEVPHSKPWLLVYATSAEFPKDEDHYRAMFWRGLFNKINDAYVGAIRNRGKAWLTGDVYMLSLDKGSELLVGKKQDAFYTENLTLSRSKAITRLSSIPQERQPSFEEYEQDILEYSKKHSTKDNGKSNNVVIIQGKANFLERSCEEFKQFASKLEQTNNINVLYIQPVGSISNHARSDILEPYSETVGYETIYTCKSGNEIASKLITFDYSEHKSDDNWKNVQKSVFDKLNKLKQQ